MFHSRARQLNHQFTNPHTRYVVDDDRFFANLYAGMRKHGHRTDMKIARAPYRFDGEEYIDVEFRRELDVPPANHLRALLAHKLPAKEIRWRDIELVAANRLRVGVQTKDERIPLQAGEIPPGFVGIGSGLFRKTSGDDHRIWALEKLDDGYVLVRKESENVEPLSVETIEYQASKKAHLKVGTQVRTPDGIGHLVAYDRNSNPIVDLDGHRFVFRTAQVIPTWPGTDPGLPPDQSKETAGYDQKREQAWLVDFYTKAFGDRTFAETLVKEEVARKNGRA